MQACHPGFMQRPAGVTTFKLREKASVFLAELRPAEDGSARAAVLAALRKREHDATHHCSAWREGAPLRASAADDDGEPGGTAGRPMLKVMEGAELTDALLVCVRWFGGTKLGTGGLVRAYTEAAQGALAQAEAEGLLKSIRVLRQGLIQVPPEDAHLPFAVLGAFPGAELVTRDFGPWGLRIRFSIPPEQAAAFESAWRERSRGGRVVWPP